MDALPTDVVIVILQLLFPLNSVLFLTSNYFNKFQVIYYEYLGCTDKASKNFMQAMMKMNTIDKIHSTRYIFHSLKYICNTIPFANETLTLTMDTHLDSFTKFIYHVLGYKLSPTDSFYTPKNPNIRTLPPNLTQGDRIRTQIIMVMAYNAVKKNDCTYHIPKTYIVDQILGQTNNMPYHIYLWKNATREFSYEAMKIMVQFNVDVVNIFYAMTGVKRSYDLSSTYHEYNKCTSCGEELDHTFECMCKPQITVLATSYNFTVTPNISSGSGNYFNYPSWYNKMYIH